MKKILLLAVVFALLGVLFLKPDTVDDTPIVTMPGAAAQREEARTRAVNALPPDVADPRDQRLKPVSDLRIAFERADDLYELMTAHAQKNNAESLWLISKIADFCAEFGRNPAAYMSDTESILKVTAVDPHSYRKSRSTVAHRCRGFAAAAAKDDIAHTSLLAHKTRAANAGSVAAEAALLSQRAPLSTDTEYLKDLVRRAMDSKDPDAYAALSMSMVDDRIFPLMQQEIRGLLDGESGMFAWYLAACRFGLDCSRDGALMTRICAEAFVCGREENFEMMVFNRRMTSIEAERIRQMVTVLIKNKGK
jgi:hypothetical protein